MNKDKKILGYYDYTVILTYVGMLFGFMGLTLVSGNNFGSAAVCLMISGVCDMFDGTIASTKIRSKNEKKFGIQIDSLSDLICFGVLPAMFVYKISGDSAAGFVIASVYALCALIRLAYFNVCEEGRQESQSGGRKCYNGLPVTSAALVIPAIYVITEQTVIFLAILPIMAALFLSPIKIKKPKIIGKIVITAAGILELSFVLIGAIGGV